MYHLPSGDKAGEDGGVTSRDWNHPEPSGDTADRQQRLSAYNPKTLEPSWF